MWARGTFSAWLPQSVPTFKLKQPAHERGGCAVDPHRLTNEPAILNSVIDNKSNFVNLEVCSSPVTAVCKGASVSCISQRLLKRLPVNFQNELQPAHRRVLVANQVEIPVTGTATLPISIVSNRYQQQFFVRKSSEADCLFDLDFLEGNHCDALFSSMQLRFPNSHTVPFFHSRKALWDPCPEQVEVIARETTFNPAVYEAVILGLLTESFPEKSEGIFEPSPAFFEKHQLLAFSSLCESGEMVTARLINPVEDVTVYKGTSLGSFSAVGSAEIAAMNRVIADLPDHPQGQVPDKYDVKEVIKPTQSSMDPQIRAQFAQLLRTFSDVFSKSEWSIGKCDLVQHKIDLYPGYKPVNLPNSRMPMHFKKDLRQKIDKVLEHKLVTPCHSPYSYVGPEENQ